MKEFLELCLHYIIIFFFFRKKKIQTLALTVVVSRILAKHNT